MDTRSTIVVTGACGFIGNYFLKLLHRGMQVVVIDNMSYCGVNSVEPHTLYKEDILSGETMREIFLKHQPRYIVNFAAESHVDRSLSGNSFLYSNTVGVENLVKAASYMKLQGHPVEKFLQVSTDEVYGSATRAFHEGDPVNPCNPYSASKAAGELVALSYHRSHGVPVVITRGANTHGPQQYPEKLLPFFITRLCRGKKVPLYGDGLQEREWMSVDDHCQGILRALLFGTPGEIYNLSSNYSRTNLSVAEEICDTLGVPESMILHIPDPRGAAHDKRYAISSVKAERDLGWKAKDYTLQDTILWYRDNASWWKSIVDSTDYRLYVKNFYGKALGDDL